MFIPKGSSEAEVLATIEAAVRVLAPQFKIPGFGIDDVLQEGRIFAMEALPRFDSTRPLANFLFTHVRLRLINLVRNQVRRSDSPCSSCRDKLPHEWTNRCKTHEAWVKRNNRKAALMTTTSFANEEATDGTTGDITTEAAETRELLARIDEGLDLELRATYLRMKAGENVPKGMRQRVEIAVREIIGEL